MSMDQNSTLPLHSETRTNNNDDLRKTVRIFAARSCGSVFVGTSRPVFSRHKGGCRSGHRDTSLRGPGGPAPRRLFASGVHGRERLSLLYHTVDPLLVYWWVGWGLNPRPMA